MNHSDLNNLSNIHQQESIQKKVEIILIDRKKISLTSSGRLLSSIGGTRGLVITRLRSLSKNSRFLFCYFENFTS